MHKPTILIIAGGKNSRFFPLNTETHKGFLSLAGKPIVNRALENLKEHGFDKVVIVVSQKDYSDKGFSKYLEEKSLSLNVKIILQKEAKGMGDALLLAKEHLSESFILASPYYFNMGEKAQELWSKKQDSGATCIFSGTHTETPELYGILDLDPQNKNKVLGIIEKPEKGREPSSIKVDSVYLLDNKFIDELANTPEEEYSFETAITTYAKKAEITWIKNKQQIKSLKYPWHLFSLFKQIMRQEKTSISGDAEISETTIIDDSNGPVIIEAGARIGDFVKISGPCYIGKNVFVGDYSFVRRSSLESGVVVGAKSEIVRSILFEESTIHFGYMSDSILGSNTQVAAGLITANKRFDRKNARSKVKTKMIDSKREALGIITGSNVQIGIGVNTMPGVLIGKNSIIYPGLTINKNVGENEIIKE